jgi:hypothetical protein
MSNHHIPAMPPLATRPRSDHHPLTPAHLPHPSLRGTFAESFLALPQEVLVMVMRKHQRYFPVFSAANPDQLLPHFITVANGQVWAAPAADEHQTAAGAGVWALLLWLVAAGCGAAG